MGNVNITPNMNLPNPVPSTDPGPDYASNLQASLNQVDSHNHSSGQGVPITPNGMLMNLALPFNNNPVTGLSAVNFTAQTSAFGTNLSLYVVGRDLYYIDGAGNIIQITSGGVVNATSSGISSGTASASFSGGVLVVKSSSTSGANVLGQSFIFTNAGNLTNQLTLQAPTLSASGVQTLPATPTQTSFMTMDGSGNMGTTIPISGGITNSMIGAGQVATGNIAANAVTPAKLSAANYFLSSPTTVTTVYVGSGSHGIITAISQTLTVSGLRPVRVEIMGGLFTINGQTSGSGSTPSFTIGSSTGAVSSFQPNLTGTTVGVNVSGFGEYQNPNDVTLNNATGGSSVTWAYNIPAAGLLMDFPSSPGTYTYTLVITPGLRSGTNGISGVSLFCMEV